MKLILVIPLATLLIFMISCSPAPSDEQKLKDFITNHLKVVEPKLKQQNLADWNANATGEKKYYEEAAAAEIEIKKIRSDKSEYAFLKKLKENNSIKDSLLQRQLTILHNSYLKNQIDTSLLRKIVEQQAAISESLTTSAGNWTAKNTPTMIYARCLRMSVIPPNGSRCGKRQSRWAAR